MPYRLDGSIASASAAVRGRWTTPRGSVTALTGWVAAVAAASLLSLAGLMGIALSLLDVETITGLMLPMQQNLNEPYFSYADIVAMQQRAIAAGVAYLALAAALVVVGPRPWALVFADAAASAGRLRRIGPTQGALLLAMTSVATVLALLHIDQVIRSDEANSFLNYGTRSPLVALGFYESTGNHILHSLLMRLSVGLFGSAEWAIRLPAMLAATASVPAIYLAARRHLGWETALVAAAAAAGSVCLVDLATNARGYSLVNLCFLLILALLPDMLRRRPAAWVAFVLLAGLGAWVVPTMIYPFAITVAWLLVRGLTDPPGGLRLRWLREVALGVAATGGLVLLLYSPVFVVTGAGFVQEREGKNALDLLRQAHNEGVMARIETVGRQLRMAWEQWIYPVPNGWAWLPLLLVAVGWGVAVARGGHARALALAAIVGPASVVVATGLVAPPWWTLAFGFVLAVVFAAVPVAAALRPSRAAIAARPPLIAATVVLLVVATGTLTSRYPDEVPYYHGYRDAPQAAAFLHEQNLRDAWIVTVPTRLRQPTNYYLLRLGHGGHVITRDMAAPPNPAHLFQLAADREAPLPDELLATTRHSFRRTDSVRLPGSWIVRYDPVTPSSVAASPEETRAGKGGGG